jgi:NAD(P)-dependent dehydrogenase (short-subunit alcohol dehydrogenase family)
MIKGAVCVVTGAASGIGYAVAKKLIEKGARHIAMVDQNPKVEDALVQLQTDIDGCCSLQAFIVDVRSSEDRRHVFNETEKRFGSITVLVPAAGITRDRLAAKVNKEHETPDIYPKHDWDTVIAVNLTAPTYWAMEMAGRIALTRYKHDKKAWNAAEEPIEGVVCFIGSVSGQGNKGQVSYSASKAGLNAVRETLDSELIYHGIHVKLVHPGYTDTAMVEKLSSKALEAVLKNVRQKRLIDPDEIAETVCFLIDTPSVGEVTADAGYKVPA